MKTTIQLLAVGLSFVCITCQETTIPVGVEGRDTLTVIRSQDASGNYDVGYNENQLTGGASFHREKGYVNGTREGSYGYTTRNGLIRIVTYVADQNGYRAQLLTNEPGISASNPSDVAVTKEQEPDREALARGPTGVEPGPTGQSQQNVATPASDAVKNYVMTPVHPASVNDVSMSGRAQVTFAAPYGQYQYIL